MRTSVLLAAVAGVLLGTNAVAQTGDDSLKECQITASPDVQIAACTAIIESGQATDESRARASSIRGSAYANSGDTDRAIQDHDQAIRLNPTDARSFYNRGLTYVRTGEMDRAIQDFDQAIRLNPNQARLFDARGFAYGQTGDVTRAIQDLDQAIRLDPNYALAFTDRGFAYLQKGEFAHAIEDFDQAIRLDPSYAETFRGRGFAYGQKGEFAHAIEDFDQAIRLDPSFAEAFNDRGVAYAQKGDVTRAIQDFEQATRLDPNNPDYSQNLRLARAEAQPCQTFTEFGSLDASKYRFAGEDAAVFLDAIEPGGQSRGWDLVLVLSLSDTPFGRMIPQTSQGTDTDVSGMYVALAGTDGCLKGRKFLGPIDYRGALAMVDRRRAGKPVTPADLERAAATGDAEARAHLGIRREIERKGAGRALVAQAAEMNIGLAVMALGYWTSGLGEVSLPGSADPNPLVDRAAAFCWLTVGSRSADAAVRQFSESSIRDLLGKMSKTEKDEGLERWNRTRKNPARPSCR